MTARSALLWSVLCLSGGAPGLPALQGQGARTTTPKPYIGWDSLTGRCSGQAMGSYVGITFQSTCPAYDGRSVKVFAAHLETSRRLASRASPTPKGLSKTQKQPVLSN